MEEFLQQFGFFASVLGGLLQGEIVYLTAMLTVSMGYLNPFSVAVAFFIGSLARDWATFWFARKKGEEWVHRKPKLQARALRVCRQLEKSPVLVLASYRFIYGFKIVILLVAGISNISWPKFATLTALSTFLWIAVFGVLGYFCGQEVIDRFQSVGEYKWQLIGIVLVGVIVHLVSVRRRKFKRDYEREYKGVAPS